MPIARSLRGRVLVWVSVALVALFILTVIGLDFAFRSTIDRSRSELLEAQLLGLIALAEEDSEGRLQLPQETINPRFGVADSGLYGVLWDEEGTRIWQSQSLVGRQFPSIASPAPGEQRFVNIVETGLPALEALAMSVYWEHFDGTSSAYTFGTAVSLERYEREQAQFRRNVISWFVVVLLTLIAVVLGVLSWVMRPLRRLAREVRQIEAGERHQLTTEQPTELVGLASNLNALIETDRSRLLRYRNSLDDLAHSLKTPLAALNTLIEDRHAIETHREDLQRQVNRMDRLVSYQLQRARAGGSTGLGSEPVDVAQAVADICLTLDKVYMEKQVRCELDIAKDTQFIGDAGDLSEMLGALIDNAYKYCKQRVQVTAQNLNGRLQIQIDDDGRGLAPDALTSLLERGTRADESVSGQGIGLAVVNETARLYDGSLKVSPSTFGGTQFELLLGRAGGFALLPGRLYSARHDTGS